MIIPVSEGFSTMMLNVWVAPRSKIRIKGKGTLHPVWEVKSTVPYQKEENRYTNNARNLFAELAHISAERNNALKKRRLAMTASSNEEAMLYMQVMDSLERISEPLNVRKSFSYIPIMEKTNISPVWLNKMREISLTLKFADLNADYIDELRKNIENLYGRMSEEDKMTRLGYEITANIFPHPIVEVGDEMVDADFFDINGSIKHLSDYSGKYLLLDFWSIGCGPCIMALPEIREIAETYRDKLTIVSISLDTDSKWKEAMIRHDMPWENIRDPKGMGGLAANYGVRGIPNYVMISPENVVIDKWAGYGTGYLIKKVSETIH